VNILYLTYSLNGLLMLLFPILIGLYLVRRYRLGWRIWWIGGFTFIASQIGHIPFNIWFFGLFQNGSLSLPSPAWELPVFAILAGLSAGIFEEVARYAAYRWWAKEARSFGTGMLMGSGHGGMEAILLGVIVLYTFANMVAIQGKDLSSLVPPEQLALAQSQVNAYWNAPWGHTLLGAVERLFTIPFHIACSVLVLQVFLRKQLRWLWLAIGYHAFVDTAIPGLAFPVLQNYAWGPYAVEGLLGLTVLIDLAILRWLQTPEPTSSQPELPPPPPPLSADSLPKVSEPSENLENSRYNNGR